MVVVERERRRARRRRRRARRAAPGPATVPGHAGDGDRRDSADDGRPGRRAAARPGRDATALPRALPGGAPRGLGRPARRDPDPARALVIRVGYGTGAAARRGRVGGRRASCPPARAAARATPLASTGRPSGWRRCSPAATSRSRARSSPCAPAAISTAAATLKLHFSSRLRSRRRSPSSPGWVTHGDLAERLEELRGYVDPVAAAALGGPRGPPRAGRRRGRQGRAGAPRGRAPRPARSTPPSGESRVAAR